MTLEQRNVIALISNAITSEQTKPSDNIDWHSINGIIKNHRLSSFAYYSANKLGLDIPTKVKNALENEMFSHALMFEQQIYELGRIESAFKKNNIDYMLLKGANIYKYYPSYIIRTMKDLDILIKLEQYESIREVMLALGFSEDKETIHEIKWRKGNVLVELHKYIESPYNKDYFSYYGDGWQLAIQDEFSCKYNLSPENEFAYILTHFAGHYKNSGIGIMHMVDFWLYLKNNKLDEACMLDILSKLGLVDFYKNIIKTLNVWFDCAPEDDVTKLITDNVFSKGKKANYSVWQVSGVAREKQLSGGKFYKFRLVLHVLFPSLEYMKRRNKFVAKCPILLPVAWVVRWFDLLLFKSYRIKQKTKNLKESTDNKVNVYLDDLKKVGLSFKE